MPRWFEIVLMILGAIHLVALGVCAFLFAGTFIATKNNPIDPMQR